MRDVDLELNDPALEAALEEVYRKAWLLEALQAQVEQEEFAREVRNGYRAMEGLGAVKREVHGFAYHDWALKLGSYDCWRDSGFLKYFDRIAPETRTKSTGTKVQVGWQGETNFYVPFVKQEGAYGRGEFKGISKETRREGKQEDRADVCTEEGDAPKQFSKSYGN